MKVVVALVQAQLQQLQQVCVVSQLAQKLLVQLHHQVKDVEQQD